jgi:uncharacterized membrane protein HdeD (DUF308 family)
LATLKRLPVGSLDRQMGYFPDGLFNTNRRQEMRPLIVVGLILIVLGIVALAVPSFTFFTRERVADAGFFTIDVSRPHTVILNPIVGAIALAVGVVLVVVGKGSTSR